MKVIIEIECETKAELMAHLSVIRSQFNQALKAFGKDEPINKWVVIADDNCYGWHEAKIKIE